MTPADAVRVAEFLLGGVRRAKGNRWDQGPRKPAWPRPPDAPEAIAVFATRRVCGVPDDVARGVIAGWMGQRPALVVDHIPTARDVLCAQAGGRRFVSLVRDEEALGFGDPRHPDGLTFALHDLCHLEKFVDPAFHLEQRGFFRACLGMQSDPRWRGLEAGFDETWRADRDYVFADMNGSAVFLFAALKMKLNMAVRRAHARVRQVPPPSSGPLTPDERASYEPALATMLEALGLPPTVVEAGWQVSARRDAPAAAAALASHFQAMGRTEEWGPIPGAA